MNKKKTDNDKETEEDLFEAIKHAEPLDLKVNLGPTTVWSIRMPSGLLDEICRQAKEHGIQPSKYARQLLEQGVAQKEDAPLAIMTQVLNNIAHQLPSTRKKAKH